MSWHGYSTPNDSLHIGPLPGRRKVALYTITDGVIDTLATFVSEESAKTTLAILDQWILCTNKTEVSNER